MTQFTIVLVNIFLLLVMALPGFLLVKFKLIGDVSKSLTALLLYVCQPLLTFVSFQNTSYEPKYLKSMLIVALFSLIVIAATFLVFFLITIKTKNSPITNMARYGAVFSNCAFMGIPLLVSIYGNTNFKIIIYLTIFIAVFNVLSWTIGIYAISGDKKYISIKRGLLNPATISLIISLVFFVLDIQIISYGYFLKKLFDGFTMFANLLTPLSMTVLGINIASMSAKEIFLQPKIYWHTAFKLFAAPLITVLILLPFRLDSIIATALVFAMAMPSAMTTILFTQNFKGDVRAASSLVLISSLLCLLTVPFIFLITSAIF